MKKKQLRKTMIRCLESGKTNGINYVPFGAHYFAVDAIIRVLKRKKDDC